MVGDKVYMGCLEEDKKSAVPPYLSFSRNANDSYVVSKPYVYGLTAAGANGRSGQIRCGVIAVGLLVCCSPCSMT